MPRRSYGMLIVATLAALAPSAWGRATVELVIRSESFFAREPIAIEITVNDFESCLPPAFPNIPGISIDASSAPMDSRQRYQVNDRVWERRVRTYSFELTVEKAGIYTIPAIPVRVDGDVLYTQPKRIEVQSASIDDLIEAEVSTTAQRVYVGQELKLQLTIYLKPARAFDRTLSAEDLYRCIDMNRSDFGPFPRPPRWRVANRPVAGGETELFYAYESAVEYRPERPGTLDLDAINVVVNYPIRFDRDFFAISISSSRRISARPTLPSIEVLALPAAGRPDNFSGAVGKFDISVSASPSNVRVGDPVKLSIDVQGSGDLETLPPPQLTQQAELMRDFRVPEERLAGEVQGVRKRFTQVVRPLRADVSTIPPIEYSYFDPQREQYVIARSQPIPLTVTAAEKLDLSDVEAIETPSEANHDVQPLDGLRGNATREDELLATVRPITLTQLAVGFTAPASLFVALWGYAALVRPRQTDPARRRRQLAASQARRRLAEVRRLAPREAAEETAAALSGYLSDRSGEPAARFAGRSALEYLARRRGDAELLQRWDALLNACEAVSFGGGEGLDANELSRRAEECLQIAERAGI